MTGVRNSAHSLPSRAAPAVGSLFDKINEMKYQKLLSFLRCCLYCGRLFEQIPLLCDGCMGKLYQYAQHGLFYRGSKYTPHVFLFLWSTESEALFRPLVYALKGGRVDRAYELLADCFLEGQLRCLLNSKKVIFIPAPSKSGAVDHAGLLAVKLAKRFQGEVWVGLKRLSQGSQKRLGREARSQVELGFLSNEKAAEAKRFNAETIVFVDDIYTTGSTCRAVRQLFDYNKKFIACTLFYRPR